MRCMESAYAVPADSEAWYTEQSTNLAFAGSVAGPASPSCIT